MWQFRLIRNLKGWNRVSFSNFTLNLILPDNNEEPSIDISNDLLAETSVIDNPENYPTSLTDTPPVIHTEENVGILDVGPISASEAENSTAPAVDLSFLDLSSPAPQEPEGTEPVQSGTDQLLDFLS